ncbi:murein transglycosylase A [Methyloceanibacter sp.]|uniref:murein transglycosylase A n=1 Tax=Methyloceanibacter sp. TaxID=1965321 RepID=UPI002D681978|nr:MltA domain-containing protein [Methyloceanibacter sp.]HZP10446.1 MltA domain-containing protein [Methyloceanibacter sp.]
MPRAALAATIALLLGACDVDSDKIDLKPVSFAELPGWEEDDHAAAFRALLKSCHADPELPYCAAAILLGDGVSEAAARSFFEDLYTPHRIEGGGTQGLVTAYYEPEVRGSREKTGAFQVPVYGKPDDLVTIITETERARFNDRITGFRDTPEGRVPYYTRAEIWGGALEGRGLELLYLDDPVELFYMQVQGSGVVRLPDGSRVRLTYAGKNGHPYTSIGKLLVERGAIAKGAANMEAVKAWLHADPSRARALMEENRSYVFFSELEASAPLGAEGVPLTAGRSLAVDAAYHRLGLPIFVAAPDVKGEDGRPFRRLMIAQDVGSAIRGPERGDIFFGTGEAAGALAGGVAHAARFYVLLPKR